MGNSTYLLKYKFQAFKFILEHINASLYSKFKIQDAILEVRIVITKADGNIPDTAKKVAPINNVGHSMWESVRLNINDKDISGTGGLYPYKAYISNGLTYDTWVKANQLQIQGWFSDTSTHMEAETGNNGFEQRCKYFKEDFDITKPYRKDGASFITRLHHDLINCESGLPPGTKVILDLDRAKDSFVLMKEESDTTEYKLKLKHIVLYVPVAQLSQSVALEINSVLTKDNPVQIQYRNIEVRTITIATGERSFNSELLFTENVPARMVIVFIQKDARQGKDTKNPFNLRRKWTIVTTEEEFYEDAESQKKNTVTENRLKQVEETNKQVLSALQLLTKKISEFQPSKKGKGKGKSSVAASTSTTASVSNNLQNITLDEQLNDLNRSDRESSPSCSFRSTQSLASLPPLQATKDYYITSINLTINGTNIDQVEDRQTKGFTIFKVNYYIYAIIDNMPAQQ